ncbi:MAG: NUDIX domain-containing protein [Phycisphaeraceae bacterium]|nr:NUDIX domain-containing protein [Phycisphaeraceae bacterium]
MAKDFSCGVIPYRIVDGERQFLLIQHNAGHWAFPKGHPENSETDLEAARRELEEETGIASVQVDAEHPLEESYTFTKRSGKRVHKRVIYFLGQVPSDQAITCQEAEVSDFAWGSAEQTRERLTFGEGRALLDTALSYLDA